MNADMMANMPPDTMGATNADQMAMVPPDAVPQAAPTDMDDGGMGALSAAP